jgi:hypothetical protein
VENGFSKQIASNLTPEIAFPVAAASLATMVSRGGGPPYRSFGRVALYRWGDALALLSQIGECSTVKIDLREGRGPSAAHHIVEGLHVEKDASIDRTWIVASSMMGLAYVLYDDDGGKMKNIILLSIDN